MRKVASVCLVALIMLIAMSPPLYAIDGDFGSLSVSDTLSANGLRLGFGAVVAKGMRGSTWEWMMNISGESIPQYGAVIEALAPDTITALMALHGGAAEGALTITDSIKHAYRASKSMRIGVYAFNAGGATYIFKGRNEGGAVFKETLTTGTGFQGIKFLAKSYCKLDSWGVGANTDHDSVMLLCWPALYTGARPSLVVNDSNFYGVAQEMSNTKGDVFRVATDGFTYARLEADSTTKLASPAQRLITSATDYHLERVISTSATHRVNAFVFQPRHSKGLAIVRIEKYK